MCEIHDAERVCICVVCVKCHIKCIFFVDDVKVGGNEMKKQKVNSNGDSAINRVANQSICPHCGARGCKIKQAYRKVYGVRVERD